MTEQYKLLMAKTNHEHDEWWLPLWMHLKDTAGVMKKLVHQWVPQSVIYASGLDFDAFERTAVFAAAVHDIGKATACFQSKITKSHRQKRDEMIDAGFTIPEDFLFAKKTPHTYAGQWILQSESSSVGVSESIAVVIGAHHGQPLTYDGNKADLLQTYEVEFYGRENDEGARALWKGIWQEIVAEACREAKIETAAELPELSAKAQVLVSGLLIVADWIASCGDDFPLISLDEVPDESLYPRRIQEGYTKAAFPEGWHPEMVHMDQNSFQERFGFLPNEIQQCMIEAVSACRQPGIFILEAQMGAGKTEAALSASELLASKYEAGGIYFGLPTQATSNGIFGRLYEWAEKVSEETVNAIELAHGAAQMNPEYEELVRDGHVYVNDIDSGDSALSVHPWFQGRKRALLADFVIGTVDQFLMASLKRRHFMLRHLGLAGKVVIIDECHAYDAYMNQYLDRSLEWMAAYGVPVILLSATLPSARREKLVKTYIYAYAKQHGGLKRPEMVLKQEGYPLLTWSDGTKVYQKTIEQHVNRKTVSIVFRTIEDAVFQLKNKLKGGGCACIILNTVRYAQQVYETVCSNIPDAAVILYHAGFTMQDRTLKEKELLQHFGKKSKTSDRDRRILIGTQVLEQSLDYDADIMMTQLCPMDLLLQRMGRLQRHTRTRPEAFKNPEFFILCADSTPSDQDNEINYDHGTRTVYGDYLLMKTGRLLRDRKVLIIPDDIAPFIQKMYGEDPVTDDGDLCKAKEDFEKEQKERREHAKGYLLPKRSKSIENILRNEDETIESAAESRVRDGTASMEVLLLKKGRDGFIRCISDESYIFDPDHAPGIGESRQILRQRLRLPYIFSTAWMIHQVVTELETRNRQELSVWQMSPLLKGELILLLDEKGCTDLCGYQISYSRELGIQYSIQEGTNAGEGV